MNYIMIKRYSIDLGGQTLKIETGHIAKQANGSVILSLGETVVLITAVASDDIRTGVDFLPLTVEYQEMSYAGGRIPGNFFRRDMGRPGEKETLISRLIDRPLRPLFPENYFFETQVIASVLASDKENEADILAINGASIALEISNIPFKGPIAAIRVGRIDGEFITNPTRVQQAESDIDLIVACNQAGIVMVESSSSFVSEKDMINAIFYGKQAMQPLLDLQEEIKLEIGQPKKNVLPQKSDEELIHDVSELGTPLLTEVLKISDKMLRQGKGSQAIDSVLNDLSDKYESKTGKIKEAMHELQKKLIRQMILDKGQRIGGRSFNQVRPIECITEILPRVHGSALFTRGETQAMVLTTLGTEQDEQRIESIYGNEFRSFILHYNFPPYSVGEAKRLGGPGRREIGHGALARRSLLPVIPSKEEFPYSIRVVSEIMESNGSSSMASVCGSSLSLMAAGVPIKAPVAGVAMGLVSEGDKTVILTDIMGDEDHFGDMDFKVAGTENGITALQMDIKIQGLSREILEKALDQAKEGRLFILKEMNNSIPEAKNELSEYAPTITSMKISPKNVRVLIGTGGKTIREISNAVEGRIDVNDDGEVSISTPNKEYAQTALDMINELLREVEVGKLYMGKVVKIMDFGAFVEIIPGTDGLVHISQMDNKRVNKVTDILQEGDEVLVKVLEVNSDGKIRLSRKAALGQSL